MIRILLVDDQNLVQQGIKSLLDRDPEIKVIGTVKDGRSAVMQITELRPDIVLLDIEMPEMDGITATKYISHLAPQTKVIILSSHEDKKYLTQALMAGAKAYILKSSMMTDLKQSIVAVNNGYSHIESRLLAKVFDPSNLKRSRSKKTRLQDSQPSKPQKYSSSQLKTPKEVEHPIQESVSVFPDRLVEANLSDAVVVNASESSMQSREDAAPFHTRTTVPKINLPHSDLDPFNAANLSEKNDSEIVVSQAQPLVEANKQLLPSKTLLGSVSQSSAPTTRRSKTFMVMVNGKNYLHKIAERPTVSKCKGELSRLWTAKTRRYKPLFSHYSSQLACYRTKIMPLLQEWHKKGWLANIGLASFGLITAIIIHQMFS